MANEWANRISKEDKMDINVAFYIDRSGSMGNSINNVLKAVF